jgi:hypothetical protein
MESKFKVNQVVRCIKSNNTGVLSDGELYIIENILSRVSSAAPWVKVRHLSTGKIADRPGSLPTRDHWYDYRFEAL